VVAAPWVVSDELWSRVGPLLPRVERRFRYPGRKRLPDRQALQGILFVLHTGIAWRDAHRWQPPRRHPTDPARRPCPAGPWPRRPATLPARPSQRRPRLRLRRPPPRTTAPWDQAADRPPQDRTWLRPGTLPLGRRAHLRLAPPLQTPARPLRPPPRDPPSLPRTRLQPRLLQTTPIVILRRTLTVSQRIVQIKGDNTSFHRLVPAHGKLVNGFNSSNGSNLAARR
jgi:transposase